jgi:hypothetical protein
MVKGVSRQVIVVKSPDPKLFEQAIFILRTDAEGISDEMLLKEARQAASPAAKWASFGPVWAAGGAVCTALVWLITALL